VHSLPTKLVTAQIIRVGVCRDITRNPVVTVHS